MINETFIHHSAASLCLFSSRRLVFPLRGRKEGESCPESCLRTKVQRCLVNLLKPCRSVHSASQTGVKLIMKLDGIEGLNEIRPFAYRAAMKLRSLQKLCNMDVVSVRHIMAAVRSVGGTQQQDVGLNWEDVTLTLNRMFHIVSQEVPSHVTAEAPEESCSLMFRLYDRTQTGSVSAGSLQTALIALSSDTLLEKYRALVSVSENGSGSVSRSGLRSLLQDLSQVPAAVQEEVVFGGVEAAVRSCFNGVLTPTASEEHVLSWLRSEPRLLLWLPSLYRLSVSQNVSHTVRCHTCKTLPITGLRYRCMKCVNVHVCQSCFLSDRQTRKHKTHHPVLEFCTQPTWRESLSSLVHSARHTLLPRRYNQREADRRRVLMWAEPGERQNSAPTSSDAATQLADSAVCHSRSSDRDVSHDASVRPPPCPSSSKALQTDEETPTQQSKASALLTEVRNLQRDKWLLEREMQVLRLTVQSEQGILEDRCSEMEVTMETLRQHNVRLQGMLTQALNKMEAQQHANNTPHSVDTERDEVKPEEDKEDEVLMKDEWSEDKLQTQSPTIHQGLPPSHDIHCQEEEEGSAGDRCLCRPIRREDGPAAACLQEEETCLSGEEEDNYGMCSPEELLQETVDRLKTVMETDRWRERDTGERKRAELLEAADQVGDSVHHLVDAVRTNTN
ncbi:dystrotelin isoform X2 [Xiphias gladius]|uniref:dystrotelin isoform X2 n=1 Tax=Xiphias gladius TaxID=8245 RepID=UPI001A98BAC8|nr:dystrotelin isoform X2 [Xiphias gladius]